MFCNELEVMYSDVRSAQSCMKQVIGPLVATFVSLE